MTLRQFILVKLLLFKLDLIHKTINTVVYIFNTDKNALCGR